MRYIKAILSTLSLLAGTFLLPVFTQWYKQTTGIEPVAFYFIAMILGLGSLILCVVLWFSAILNKDIKDLS